MDILSYLSELLQQHTSVGLSNLGTFYKKKFAGRYDKEKQSFLPPGYTLQFTSEVKDEHLLSKFISEKKNISLESAEHYIAQFVEETNKKLEIEHEAKLDHIGRLFFTEHEGLSFEPIKNINYGSEFFGLPAIAEKEVINENPIQDNAEEATTYEEIAEAPSKDSHLTEVEEKKEHIAPVIENIELDEVKDDLKHTLSNTDGETIDVEHEEVTVPEFVKEQHAEHPNRFGHQPESEASKTYINLNDADANNINIIAAPEFIKEQHTEHPNRFGHDPLQDESDERKSFWNKILIGAVILLVLGLILYLIKPELFNPQAKVETESVAAIDSPKVEKIDSTKIKQDSVAKTDSILRANQVNTTTNGQTKKAAESPTVNLVNANKKSGPVTYDVIAASFKTKAKAEQFVKQMKKYGIDARIVSLPGRLKKVSIASFKTEKEAYEQRPILAQKINIKELDIIQINTTP